jgi:hypothetical protein
MDPLKSQFIHLWNGNKSSLGSLVWIKRKCLCKDIMHSTYHLWESMHIIIIWTGWGWGEFTPPNSVCWCVDSISVKRPAHFGRQMGRTPRALPYWLLDNLKKIEICIAFCKSNNVFQLNLENRQVENILFHLFTAVTNRACVSTWLLSLLRLHSTKLIFPKRTRNVVIKWNTFKTASIFTSECLSRFFFFVVLRLEFKTYTLSHSTQTCVCVCVCVCEG